MPPFVQKRVYSDPMVDYLNYAHDVRGRLINQVAEMEREIDDYIARYFCQTREKRSELMEIIIATKHLTFIGKAEIVKCLLVKSGDATVKEANKIYEHLSQTIAKNRNIIAHNTLDTSTAVIHGFKTDKKKTIYFFKYANTKTSEPFTKQKEVDITMLSFNIKEYFRNLKTPVKNK